MIDRYKDDYMDLIWSDEYKYGLWNKITTLYIKHQAGLETSEKSLSPYLSLKKIKEYEKTTKHEVVAFLKAYSEMFQNTEHSKLIHYGLTSSDLIDTADSLRTKDSLIYLEGLIDELVKSLNNLAIKNLSVYAAGRTHGKHAEKINWTLRVHHLVYELSEIKLHLNIAKRACYGKLAGPVGNSAYVNLEATTRTLKDLNLARAPFTTQVIPRIHNVQIFYLGALLGAAYERFCTMIRLSCIDEINEIQEGFTQGQAGSSAMPHKNNPILSENITGLSRMLKAQMGPALENVNLWWERDISHSSVERVMLPQLFHLTTKATSNMIKLVNTLNLNKEAIANNLSNAEVSSHEKLLKETQLTSRFEAYAKVQTETMRTY